MKKTYIYIAFIVVSIIAFALSIIYFLNIENKQTTTTKLEMAEENNILPKGVISTNQEDNTKEIGGKIVEISLEKIKINVGNEENNNIEIEVDKLETINLKGVIHPNSLGYDLSIIESYEELNKLKQKGTYIQATVSEIVRESGEITYHAKAIVYFSN